MKMSFCLSFKYYCTWGKIQIDLSPMINSRWIKLRGTLCTPRGRTYRERLPLVGTVYYRGSVGRRIWAATNSLRETTNSGLLIGSFAFYDDETLGRNRGESSPEDGGRRTVNRKRHGR